MDFTPKKERVSSVSTSTIRHNPYHNAGRARSTYLNRFSQHPPVTPVGRLSVVKNTPPTRSDRILAASKSAGKRVSGSPATKRSPVFSASKSLPVIRKVHQSPPRYNQSSQSASKRPFSSVNGEVSSNDPYNVFEDSDEENRPSPRKEVKSQEKENRCQQEFDELLSSYKESPKPLSCQNTNFYKPTAETSRPKAVRVYTNTNKRKPLQFARSRLVSDISPEKVERAFTPKSLFQAEKENVPTQSVLNTPFSNSQVLSPHLIGFPNYGNTCYLNSVLQSLLGLPTFFCDYRQISSELGLNHKSLSYGLGQVLNNRMKGQSSGVKVSLRTIKENLERIDGSFSGFKMQDANEFLTKVLDTIKDEIDGGYASHSTPVANGQLQASRSCGTNDDSDEDIFLSGDKEKPAMKVVNISAQEEFNLGCSDFTDNDIINVGSQSNGVAPKVQIINKCNGNTNGSKSSNVEETSLSEGSNEHIGKQPQNGLKNPVKDNFEFQLLESYRCLGCGKVEGRKQSYFGLYVNLPDNGGHTLQDAVSSYMGADERELTCEECGHKTSSVVTTVTSVPRILIIQLKRYEYKPEQCESIKMSSKVHVDQWITLDEYTTSDVPGPSHWNPESKSSSQGQTGEGSRQSTLTTRNLSSELNKDGAKEEKEEPDDLPELIPDRINTGSELIPDKISTGHSTPPRNEEEDLQLAITRSMEETQCGQEEDEIQQAIRLSLQEMGMSYSQENKADDAEQEDEEKNGAITVAENQESARHSYCLISIISHFGLTTNTGHYVSDVYNCDEESWFHYDDESVNKISESVVFAEGRQKNGYIFFYMHKDLFQKMKNKSKR